MEGLIMTGQLLLALSILVGLHEWGHYITAKWFKMRVNKFYLFFDFLFPLPNVLNFSLWKKQIGDTTYGLGWFPLGGYVDIAGMIDESKDASQLESVPQPWEFRSKPAWQRLIVMLGGIIVNVIIGVTIFVGMALYYGHDYLKASDVKYGIVAQQFGKEIGLKTGDKIVAINDKPFDDFADIRKVFIENNSNYTVERDGKQLTIYVPNNLIEKISDKKTVRQFVEPIEPFKIGEVSPAMPASKAGLKMGDSVVAVNNQPVQFYHELQDILTNNKNKPLNFSISRAGKTVNTVITPNEDGKIGFYPELLLKTTHVDYNFGEALVAGTANAFNVVIDNIKGFGKIFRGEVAASKALSGPIGIAQMFGGVWIWQKFWLLTGMLSMVLAFMNLLPIPALDGGHALILLYEMVTGRKPSDKFLEVSQSIGMVILLGLMVFAFGNDIFKIFK
jgi:regulator of sigma E protease